jgi:hypothetical protein
MKRIQQPVFIIGKLCIELFQFPGCGIISFKSCGTAVGYKNYFIGFWKPLPVAIRWSSRIPLYIKDKFKQSYFAEVVNTIGSCNLMANLLLGRWLIATL